MRYMEPKMFGKWDLSEVDVTDPELKDMFV